MVNQVMMLKLPMICIEVKMKVWMVVMMMVSEARVEAGRLLPTGQSDTGKFSAAGKHYFTLEYSRAC